jgi:hypothetical protein
MKEGDADMVLRLDPFRDLDQLELNGPADAVWLPVGAAMV